MDCSKPLSNITCMMQGNTWQRKQDLLNIPFSRLIRLSCNSGDGFLWFVFICFHDGALSAFRCCLAKVIVSSCDQKICRKEQEKIKNSHKEKKMRRENSKKEGCRWKMEKLQFTSTKTNWNTREINHHHLPPSLPPFDSISPHLHVPMELAAIFHPRGRPNSTELYVWYTWGQTFPGKHIQLLLKKKQVTVESKYSL